MARIEEQGQLNLESVDFKRRDRNGTIRNIGLCYFAALIYLIIVIAVIDAPAMGHYIALAFAFGILSVYAVYTLQKNLDLITDVEFHNAIFSTAIAQQGMFTLVIRPDGSVAYADERFRTWFPGVARESDNVLNAMFEAMDLALSDKERILQSIQQQRAEHLLFRLTDERGFTHMVRLTCRPLQRPHGLMLLQGREFVAARMERESVKDAGGDSPVKFITTLLDDATAGAFACSPSGYIRIANKALEEKLGYLPGEICSKQLQLSAILYEEDKAGELLKSDSNGKKPVMLVHKNGSIVKTTLSHLPLYDVEGNLLAVAGLIGE